MKGWLVGVIVIGVLVIILIVIGFLIFLFTKPSAPPLIQNPEVLRLSNESSGTLWISATVGDCNNPLPGYGVTDFSVAAGSYKDITLPTAGLNNVKIFAKVGCDNNGTNCLIGNSLPGYTGPVCPVQGCSDTCNNNGPCRTDGKPCDTPVNSLVEFNFGVAGSGTTTYLGNNVAGFTVPYSVTTDCGSSIDATAIDINNCPFSIDLSYQGITMIGSTDITKADLRVSSRSISRVVGCNSPCSYFRYGLNDNISAPSNYYCCKGTDEECRQASNNVYATAVGSQSYSSRVDNITSTSCPSGGKKYIVSFYDL